MSSPSDRSLTPELKPTLSPATPNKGKRGRPSTSDTPNKKSRSPKSTPKGSVIGSAPATPGSGVANKGSWKKEEVRMLWEALDIIPKSFKWDDVSNKIGGVRDKLACRNKWTYDLRPKLEAFIDSLGD